MNVIEVCDLNKYKVVEPDYGQLCALVRRFGLLRGLPESLCVQEPFGFFTFAELVADLFKAGEDEKNKGIVQDFFTWLKTLGVPFQPYIVTSR